MFEFQCSFLTAFQMSGEARATVLGLLLHDFLREPHKQNSNFILYFLNSTSFKRNIYAHCFSFLYDATSQVGVTLFLILKLPFLITGFDILSYSNGKRRKKSLIKSAKEAYFCFFCVNLLVRRVLQTIFLFTSWKDLNVSMNVVNSVERCKFACTKIKSPWSFEISTRHHRKFSNK